MATITILKPRVQVSHFGLYRTSAGGDESIFVRRKVGDPTDYMHTKSRKLALQRYYLTLASKHYAHLTPSQKAITRHQFAEVEFETGHSRTDTKLLSGRQLFISQEMHSLKTTGKQLSLPYEVCIILTDPDLNPLEGQLKLYFKKDGDWQETRRELINTADWLFSLIPAGKASYHPIGEAIGYFDPENPEITYLHEAELKQYHYHKLYPTGIPEKLFDCLGNSGMLEAIGDTYQEAREASQGTVSDNRNVGTTGQEYAFGYKFHIWRAGLFFDTTQLLQSHEIVEAYLRLQPICGGYSSAIAEDDQHLRILNGADLSPSGLQPSDYHRIGSQSYSYGETDPDTYRSHCSNHIDIPIAHSLITKEGITKIALRGTHDINNIQRLPPFVWNKYDYKLPTKAQTGWAWLRIKYLD